MIENKRKHLELIQGIVNRLSTNSFLLKGWSVALVSAMFALSSKDSRPAFLFLAYIPAVIFWGLDGYCLWQERLFRALYKHVRVMPDKEVDFCMSTEKIQLRKGLRWLDSVFSLTLIAFHGALIIAIVLVMFLGLTK
jgi:hypothetical protein